MGSADGEAVQVSLTVQTVHRALAVPIAALVALAGGGYGLELAGPSVTPSLVGVRAGVFASGMVQVIGASLHPVRGSRWPSDGARVEPVSKQHEATPPVDALHDISLSIDAGEFVAVTGPSGSGKSTLLAVAGTLERPTAGPCGCNGTPSRTMHDDELSGIRASTLGFIFQQFHLLPTRSVLQNVADGLLYRGPRGGAARARDRRDRRGRSGAPECPSADRTVGRGMPTVAIARAIVGAPALLLADEPTGNLDSETGNEIFALLDQLNAGGATILLVTHNAELAQRLPRAISLRDGRIESERSAV